MNHHRSPQHKINCNTNGANMNTNTVLQKLVSIFTVAAALSGCDEQPEGHVSNAGAVHEVSGLVVEIDASLYAEALDLERGAPAEEEWWSLKDGATGRVLRQHELDDGSSTYQLDPSVCGAGSCVVEYTYCTSAEQGVCDGFELQIDHEVSSALRVWRLEEVSPSAGSSALRSRGVQRNLVVEIVAQKFERMPVSSHLVVAVLPSHATRIDRTMSGLRLTTARPSLYDQDRYFEEENLQSVILYWVDGRRPIDQTPSGWPEGDPTPDFRKSEKDSDDDKGEDDDDCGRESDCGLPPIGLEPSDWMIPRDDELVRFSVGDMFVQGLSQTVQISTAATYSPR